MSPTPSEPGPAGYVLDWALPENHHLPLTPPRLWTKEYDAGVRHADEPQIRAASRIREQPVRQGDWSVRFQLCRGDPVIGTTNGVRAELAADFEPVGATRWYGFSIYLPYTWGRDRSAEVLTQWHQHWSLDGSPSLAIQTRNGQWEISQNCENSYSDVPVGEYETGRWTDWVVFVRWSSGSDGRLTVWKDGSQVPGFDGKPGKNTYADALRGNYMKFGIYKWCWNPVEKPDGSYGDKCPSDSGRRVMYYDGPRIMDEHGSYDGVAPPSTARDTGAS